MPPPTDRLSPQPGQLKVMISSTTLDLPTHRERVIDAIWRAGCFPLAMEHGSATSNSDAIRFSLEMVDQADIYVGIFAQRYGSIPDKENLQRWSVTEHEYRRAVARGIPRLLYLSDKEHKFIEEEIDFDPEKRAKLQALRKEIETQEIRGFFSSPEKLHSLVVQSLFKEKERQDPAIVAEPRAQVPIPRPPDLYAVPPYTLTNTFVGRRAELIKLDSWAASTDPVIVVEAIGGMGKSALTWEWAQRHAAALIPGLAGRVWWSFYERGTSMKTFLRHALAYVTRQDPEFLGTLDTYDTGQRLLTELRRKPYLLVLDGFERVLTAYHRLDKAQMQDHQVPVDKRECTNPKDGDILRQLVHCGPSKVLVSSRLMPRALEDRHTHQQIPGVRRLELAGLAPADALDLVRNSGVHGDPVAILHFIDQFDRHALVLRIVCGMIADYRPKPGDFNAWQVDPYAGGGLKLSELSLKQRYTHILESAFRGLNKKTRQLLSRIAVLSDGADYALIAVLNPFLPPRPKEIQEPKDLDALREFAPASKELAEFERQKEAHQETMQAYFASAKYHKALVNFHSALKDLEDRGLLQWDRDTNTYDLHPVVRAYAFERLEEQERTGTYNTVRDHFSNLPPEKMEKATELTHVKNSIEIMRALIGAGRLNEALNFYKGSFGQSLMFSIGAYHIIIELLSPLLRDNGHWLGDQIYVTNAVAGSLFYLERLDEAAQLCYTILRMDLDSENCADLAQGLRNWGTLMKDMNRLASAVQAFQLAYEMLETVGYEYQLTRSILVLGVDACTRGKLDEAEVHFTSFQQRERPEFAHYRPGDVEYWLAQLKFWQRRLTAKDLDHADRISADGRNLVGKQRLAALRAEWELARDNPAVALEAIEQALAINRRTGTPAPNFLGLRALILARLGRPAEAHEALAEAEEIWTGLTPRFPLAAAETWLALGESEHAREYVRRAYPLAWADGPPYINWYELKRCRELMAKLGEPEPQLSPFDPAKVKPVPFEAEIRALIEKLKAESAKKAKGRRNRMR